MSQITEAYFPSVRTQDEVIHRSVLKPESTDNKGIAWALRLWVICRSFLGMILFLLLRSFDAPFTTPMLPLSFMLLSFIRTVPLRLCVSIMLHWLRNDPFVLCHELSHSKRCLYSFIVSFPHSFSHCFLLFSQKGSYFLVSWYLVTRSALDPLV